MSDIGVKIGVDGEMAFKKAIAQIGDTLKLLGSEMKIVTAQYDRNDKSAQALTARNQALTSQIAAQKDKVELLRGQYEKQSAKLQELGAELQNATDKYGENSKEVASAQKAYDNQAAAVNKLGVDTNNAVASVVKMERQLDGNETALRDVARGYNDAGQKLDEYGNVVEEVEEKQSNFGDVLKGIGVGMAAVAAAAGAAAVALGKQVISAYADYEQLVGGVDTLFKDSSAALQDYANDAYKTAGLSANEYMETVTSFSASLISSLGGDTEAAVKYADMAITDMSDNANKMGTDMASIQNAYQGFAKQNYTMLDNLKLGYGGTKSEMERLLADAEKISGFKYDVSSYADIVDAIHVVQTELGITGTTALEAEETITGSANAMKSAWQNWLVGLGNSKADMRKLTQNLVDGFTNIVKNITPIIENIVSALPAALEALLPAIAGLLPMLLETATSLFGQVVGAIMQLLPEFIPVAVDALLTIVDTLIANIPMLIDAAMVLITSLAGGLIDALPELVPALVAADMQIRDTLIDNIDMLIDAAIEIIMALADGLIASLPMMIEKVPTIIIKLVQAIANNLPKIMEAGIGIIVALAGALIQAIPQLVEKIPEIITAIVEAFESFKAKIKEIGENIVKGVWEGIQAMATWIKDKVSGFFGGIVDGVKGVLGIKSPSRVFAGIGENMAAGLGVGFADQMKSVQKQINDSVPTSFSTNATITATTKAMEGAVNGMASLVGNSGGTFIIQTVLDGRVIAETIFDPLKSVSRQRGVALA